MVRITLAKDIMSSKEALEYLTDNQEYTLTEISRLLKKSDCHCNRGQLSKYKKGTVKMGISKRQAFMEVFGLRIFE